MTDGTFHVSIRERDHKKHEKRDGSLNRTLKVIGRTVCLSYSKQTSRHFTAQLAQPKNKTKKKTFIPKKDILCSSSYANIPSSSDKTAAVAIIYSSHCFFFFIIICFLCGFRESLQQFNFTFEIPVASLII